MKKILLVEDDKSLGQTLSERLERDYQVTWAETIEQAWKSYVATKNFDLILLDVGLADGNGFELAKKIKADSSVPFMFLTAQADAESRLEGFEIGAEEFIPKPFHLKELLLRVRHVLEAHTRVAKEIQLRDCTLNFDEMTIRQRSGSIDYPAASDMKILQILIENSPRVLSRDEIMNEVWGVDKNPSHRTVDNIIARLRPLLGADGDNIRSVRGVGYQWTLNPEEGNS